MLPSPAPTGFPMLPAPVSDVTRLPEASGAIPPELVAAFVGYFVSKFMEWLKTTPYVSWVNPNTTGLVQFLTAVVSVVLNLGFAVLNGAPLEASWTLAGPVLFNALITYVTAEFNYHWTLKDRAPKVFIGLTETPPSKPISRDTLF